jgi:hypothetical protein
MSKRVLIGLVGSFVLVVGTAVSSAVTVANASFENPNVAYQPYGFEYSPTLAEQGGSGWTFSNDFAIVANGGFGTGYATMSDPPDGTQAGAIQFVSYIEQSISGFSAGSYTMSFYVEGRDWAQGPNPLQVSVDGTLLTFGLSGNTITPAIATSFTLYQSNPFTVTAGAHELEIAGTDSGLGGSADETSFIDAVSVTAIPEPTSFALVAVGLTALLYHSRRRRVVVS